jgi:uncharacterized membrane protein YccC
MELKEMILSTLKELDEVVQKEEKQTLQPPKKREESAEESFEPETFLEMDEEIAALQAYVAPVRSDVETHEFHEQFYRNLRERILVLFEGFQSPNNKNIEAKIDLTLNFLEYLLATIDEQLEKMEHLKS